GGLARVCVGFFVAFIGCRFGVAQCWTGEGAHAAGEIVVLQAASLQPALNSTTITGWQPVPRVRLAAYATGSAERNTI
ncbi:MAG: hypothetical protein KDB14_18865, partial [Planctomycetales bacterium]|nr:hypothetical protein [Planctomycetales bacterium]